MAVLKVVAGLIALPLDDVRKRDALADNRRIRIVAAGVAVVAALAMVAGVLTWEHLANRQQNEDLHALVLQLVATSQAQAAPGREQSVGAAVAGIAKGAAEGDARQQQALDLLKAGKIDEASRLLLAFANDKTARIEQDSKETATAWRNLGTIAGLRDPKRAREYYAEAARLDPSDVSGMLQNGWFQQQAGQLDAAQAAYARVIAMTKPGRDDEALIWAQLGTGDIQSERGNLGAALATYQGAEAIADRLAKSDPGNADWQRDLSVAYERIGDVKVAGDLAGALKSYRDGLAIRDRLAKSDPGQRDLSVAYEKVGDVLRAQGDFAGALTSYRDGLTIRDRLAKSDPGNALWQRDLSVAYNKVGDVQVKQGDFAGAEKSYRDSLAIRDRLAKSDPSNAEWQRDLSVSYDRVGDVQGKQGDLEGAEKSYRDSLAIRDRLAKSDPSNAEWQRDLAGSYDYVGDVQMA